MQLRFGKSVNGKAEVEVRDMSGKLMVNGELLIVNGLTSLATTRLLTGSYVVKVAMGDEVYVQKMVVK